jgi:conjugative relaxase-like TrwC/TraI family protein
MVTGSDNFGENTDYLSVHLTYNDYAGQKVDGYWWGLGCKHYGVEAGKKIEDEEFKCLQGNRHAITGEQITTQRKDRKPFYDMVIAATKTGSIAAISGKSKIARSWHDVSADKVRTVAERWIVGRQAHDGKVHVERTHNACAGRYQHEQNRALEVHLHDHNPFMNMTRSENGRDYAIEFRDFMEQSGTTGLLTAIYNDQYAAEMIAYGQEPVWDEYGAPQIRELLELKEISQQRSDQIEERIAEIEEFAGTKLSRKESKTISLASRGIDIEKFKKLWEKERPGLEAMKTLEPETSETVRREMLATFTKCVRKASTSRLQEATPEQVKALQGSVYSQDQWQRLKGYVASLEKVIVSDRSQDIHEDIEFAIEHLFSRKSVVNQFELYTEIIKHARGKGVDINHMVARVAEHPGLVLSQAGEVTTIEHFTHSVGIIKAIEEGRGKGIAVSSVGISEQLNESQKPAVIQLLESKDRVNILSGLFGVGKTFSLTNLVEKNAEAGHRVVLCAPTIKARTQLRKAAEKVLDPAVADMLRSATTLQRFLLDRKLQSSLRPNDLVILDEASLASSKQGYDFLEWGNRTHARQLVVGDPTQIHGISAGDFFRVITDVFESQTAKIEKIIRQKPEALNGHYLKAMELFGQDRMKEGFFELHKAGAIKEKKGKERIDAYAEAVLRSLDGTCSAVASNLSHRENDEVATAVRAKLKEQGKLTDEREITVFRSRGWTEAEKREIKRLQPGYVLEVIMGTDQGRAFTVLEVCKKGNAWKAVTEDVNGEKRTFGREHARMFDVAEARRLPVSVGDRMIANSTGRSVPNGMEFTVAGWDARNNPVTTEGKTITHRNISHGYSTTVIKVQSETEKKAIFSMDRHSIRAVSRQIVKVATSRGETDIEVFVENLADLALIQKRSGDRKDPLEMKFDSEIIQKEWRPNVQALFGELQRIQNGKGDPGKVVELCKQVDLQAGARRRADDNEKERMTRGFLCIDGWAGRREIPCEVLKETGDKVLIRLEQDCALPGRNRRGTKGQEIYVPKSAIRRAAAVEQQYSAQGAQSKEQGVGHER